MSPHPLLSAPRFARALALAGLLAAATRPRATRRDLQPAGRGQGRAPGHRALRAADGARSAIRASVDPFDDRLRRKRARGRWADPRNWVYDFARDLPAGVRCAFTLKPGLDRRRRQRAVAGGQRFEFSTGGPAILRSLPYEGSRIDENQVFILGLDAPAKPDTIAAHAHCVAAGVNEEIGVRLVTGDERKTILDNRKSFAASYLRVLLLDGGDGPHARRSLFRLPATGSDRRQVPAAARRARLAARHARLRAHAAAGRRSEAGLGQGHRGDHRRRDDARRRRSRSRCGRRSARRSRASA